MCFFILILRYPLLMRGEIGHMLLVPNIFVSNDIFFLFLRKFHADGGAQWSNNQAQIPLPVVGQLQEQQQPAPSQSIATRPQCWP